MDFLFQILFFAYVPVQLALLIAGLVLLIRKPRTRTKTIWGIVSLVVCGLMLPLTPVMAAILYMFVSGEGFGG